LSGNNTTEKEICPMSYDNSLKGKLLKILKEKSLIIGDIILASGKRSSYYIDVKMTSLDSEGVVLCAKLFASQLNGLDYIGGPTLGADPFLGAILYECHVNNKPMSAFIVRKESKSHGTQKLIEGPIKKGTKVALIEDVITTGGSVYSAIQTVENFGAKVTKVLTLIDREDGGIRFLEDKGYPVFPVFKKSDLGV
jgi:orotate phosphoribosyltransferase